MHRKDNPNPMHMSLVVHARGDWCGVWGWVHRKDNPNPMHMSLVVHARGDWCGVWGWVHRKGPFPSDQWSTLWTVPDTVSRFETVVLLYLQRLRHVTFSYLASCHISCVKHAWTSRGLARSRRGAGGPATTHAGLHIAGCSAPVRHTADPD